MSEKDFEAKIKALRDLAKTRRLTQAERNEMTAAKIGLQGKSPDGSTKSPAVAGTSPAAEVTQGPVPPPKIEDNPIIKKIKNNFSQAIREAYYALDKVNELTVILNKDFLIPVAKFLKSDLEMDFDYLADLCGVDYPDREERFEVVTHLYSLKNNHRIRLKVPLKENESIPSLSKIWKTANWHEREAYDLFGINFAGHSDLRRILLPRKFDGFPLRKDFPLKGKEGDSDIMKYMDYYD